MDSAQAAQNSESNMNASAPASGGAASLGSTIEMTAKAVKEIRRIVDNDPSAQDGMLRVMVVGGGCSGMSYKLGFDNQPVNPNDKVFEKDGVKLVVDAKSFLFLKGTELDFTDGLNGTGFVFKNPNAKRTCGCGSSFSA